MTKKQEPAFVDEYLRIMIHKSELKNFPKQIQKFIDENARIEMYPNGLKKGKPFNKVAEFKRLVKKRADIQIANKGEETNLECHICDSMCELLEKMMLSDFRKLGLEYILGK